MGKTSKVRASLPKRRAHTPKTKTPSAKKARKTAATTAATTPATSSSTKKAASASSGGRHIPTRSAAENKKLKEENEKLKREIEQLKSGDASNESEDESEEKPKIQKVKAKATKKKAKAKALETGVWAELKDALKEKECNDIKFLNSESDEHQLMKACLQSTNQWARIQDLSEEELNDEVQTYVDAYGSKLCAEMNRTRSAHQSNLKKVWSENRNKDLIDPSQQLLLRVARRDPKHLQILPEDTGNRDQDAKNEDLNEENKKCRDRFRRLMCHYVAKVHFEVGRNC